ncbi:MAG: MoaF N-terminal domain-containing protein [Oscillospiraceae bacterium]|nr:MoaF N-terminal domain-containing protein [Oscillospiraceae bacterium]MBQ3880378.1 MoaF N-terminal domain-containing protein [Oscillospiraceae bacterium]
MLARKQRRWPYLTLEEVKEKGRQLDTKSIWRDSLSDPMLVTSDALVGKKLGFTFENGLHWSYEFEDVHHLRWSASDGRGGAEFYNASPAPGYPNFIFLHHYCSLEIPSCADVLIDFDTGYAVLFDASLGHPDNPREIRRTIRFGTIDGAKIDPNAEKPWYTNDLTGKAIRWTTPARPNGGIKYIFSTYNYLTYVMKFRDGTSWVSTNPCDCIKFRDDLYLCSTIEERQTGVELIMLENLTLMTDVQTSFGIGGPTEDANRLETAMHSGRIGHWDTMDTDLYNE